MHGFTVLFESGVGDKYWCVEECNELLYVTSNAETRRLITPAAYAAWDGPTMRAGLEAEGVPADLIDRIMGQAGF